jgi:hypothetical protein
MSGVRSFVSPPNSITVGVSVVTVSGLPFIVEEAASDISGMKVVMVSLSLSAQKGAPRASMQ